MSVAAAPPGDVGIGEARAALAAVVPRLVTLIRTIHDPDAHAVGEWSAGDVALHLTTVWETLPALARREIPALLDDVWDLGELTKTIVRSAPDRDPLAAARFIESAAGEFIASTATARGDEPALWLLRGVEVRLSTIACHILSECLVHGYDIARAERRPWRIDPDHATLVLRGFIMSVAPRLDARTLVVQERARDVDACYALSLRGDRGRMSLRIADGMLTVSEQPQRRPDCHITADPAALLLQFFGRHSLWRALATGRLVAWGRRPWLAPRIRTLLRNP